jgi:hypothetical protein
VHGAAPRVFDYATYFKSKENVVPESRTRKSAADKQKMKAQQATKPKKIKPPASRRWVPPTFIAVGLLGVAWLITYYVAGHTSLSWTRSATGTSSSGWAA